MTLSSIEYRSRIDTTSDHSLTVENRISDKVQSLRHSIFEVEGERKELGADGSFCAQQVETISRDDGLNIAGIHLLIISDCHYSISKHAPKLVTKKVDFGHVIRWWLRNMLHFGVDSWRHNPVHKWRPLRIKLPCCKSAGASEASTPTDTKD